jgi:hypothetical protein
MSWIINERIVVMSIFDPSAEKTKLIIVHSENTEEFANLLRNLISSNDDQGDTIVGVKDGTVEVAVWSDKVYAGQKPTLSSCDHYLFIGRGKIQSKEGYGMNTVFDHFGMKYGWLGNQAFLKVDDYPLKRDEVEEFISFIKNYDPTANLTIPYKSEDSNQQKKRFLKDYAKLAIPVPFLGAYLLVKDHRASKNRIRSISYKALTIAFYKEGLASFLEG